MDLKRFDRMRRAFSPFKRRAGADPDRAHTLRSTSVPTREERRGQFLEKLLKRYPDLGPVVPSIQKAYLMLKEMYAGGGKLLICGNGGSAADCEHIVGELMKGFLSHRPVPAEFRARLADLYPGGAAFLADHLQGALPAISLVSQVALLTAYANDVAPEMVFAQQVYGYGRPGDALLGISTSGASSNVLYALQVARAMGLRTIGLTGRGSDAMLHLCDAALCIPADGTADIQERHLAVYHTLCGMLEQAFFPR
jgi:phosphoheptose isomerase